MISIQDNEFRNGASKIAIFALLGNMIATGSIILNSFSVFLLPLAAEFSLSRAGAALTLTFITWSAAAAKPMVGFLIDRHGVRRVLIISTIGFGVLGTLLSFSKSSYQLYALCIPFGLFMPGIIGIVKLATLWFDKWRGRVIALIPVGGAVSAAIVPILLQQIVGPFGWRAGYFAIGMWILLVSLPCVLMLVHEPSKSTHNSKNPQEPSTRELSLRSAIGTREFWLLGIAMYIESFCRAGFLSHVVPIMSERGFNTSQALLIPFWVGIGSLVGQILIGTTLDRINSPKVISVATFVSLIGMMILSRSESVPYISAGAFVWGSGAYATLTGFLFSRYFGVRSLSTIYAVSTMFNIVITGLAPVFIGALFDYSGSYSSGLLVFQTLSGICIILTLFVRHYSAIYAIQPVSAQ